MGNVARFMPMENRTDCHGAGRGKPRLLGAEQGGTLDRNLMTHVRLCVARPEQPAPRSMTQLGARRVH